MIKDLFPLKTFHQDAVLKRLDELAEKSQSEDDVLELMENGEPMSGYSFTLGEINNVTLRGVYAGVVKNGNKVTFVVAVKIKRTDEIPSSTPQLGIFNIPKDVFDRLHQTQVGGSAYYLTVDEKPAWSSDSTNRTLQVYSYKAGGSATDVYLELNIAPLNELTIDTDYYFRYEFTCLLSDNLIPQP